VARQPADEATLWSSVMAAKAILLAVYVTVVLLAGWAIGYDRRLLAVIGLMATVQGLISVEQTTNAVFAGRQNFKPAVMLRLGKIVVETLVTVAVLSSGFSLVGLAVSRVIVTMVSGFAIVVLAFRTLGVRPTRPSVAVIRPLL